ncbi:hypothetical protein Tco_1422921 [Tanacetum coccineum]
MNLNSSLRRTTTGEINSYSDTQLGGLSINAYFWKIELIATILVSLGSPIRKDDIVNITLNGLPDKYQDVSDIIIHQEPFPYLKTVRSMLTMAEMRLKSRVQDTSIDSSSSSHVVLLANSGNNTARRSFDASRNGYSRKGTKKKAKNKQIQARNGKDKVKSQPNEENTT